MARSTASEWCRCLRWWRRAAAGVLLYRRHKLRSQLSSDPDFGLQVPHHQVSGYVPVLDDGLVPAPGRAESLVPLPEVGSSTSATPLFPPSHIGRQNFIF